MANKKAVENLYDVFRKKTAEAFKHKNPSDADICQYLRETSANKVELPIDKVKTNKTLIALTKDVSDVIDILLLSDTINRLRFEKNKAVEKKKFEDAVKLRQKEKGFETLIDKKLKVFRNIKNKNDGKK